jgi:hypothetical protein
MPTPNENETQQEFINRCIPMVINEGTAQSPEQAFAICQSMFERNAKMVEILNKIVELLQSN